MVDHHFAYSNDHLGVKSPIFRQTHQGVAEWNRMVSKQLQTSWHLHPTKNGTCWVGLSFSGHCLATPWKDGFLQFITTNPWDFTFQSLKKGCPTSPIPTSYKSPRFYGPGMSFLWSRNVEIPYKTHGFRFGDWPIGPLLPSGCYHAMVVGGYKKPFIEPLHTILPYH